MAELPEELAEEVRVMRDTIRRFVEEELDPIANQVEEEDRIPDHIVERMRELGLFGMVVPERYFRDLRVYRLYEGTSEIQRLVIARRFLNR